MRDELASWLATQFGTDAVDVGDFTTPEGVGYSNETVLVDATWTDGDGVVHEDPLVVRLETTGDGVFPSYDLTMQVGCMRQIGAHTTAIIMANIPLALIGSVAAMWLTGTALSVASMVGFITLAGIATRNGILKVSHYINLCKFEGEAFGEAMIARGSLERLTPVLMTALVAAFALTPLLVAADAPGKEILHPVAVVIFGGLISSTALDTVLTPLLFWLYGAGPMRSLLAEEESRPAMPPGEAEAAEAY